MKNKYSLPVLVLSASLLLITLAFVSGCGSGASSGGGSVDTGTEIFVSVTGSDTTGNGSQTKPYRTISKGIVKTTAAKAIVTVMTGVYSEPLVSWFNTAECKMIKGVSQGLTTLEGRLWVMPYSPSTAITITIESMTITGGGGFGHAGGAIAIGGNVDGSDTVHIRNILFKDNSGDQGGALLNQKAIVLVESCIFQGNHTEVDYGGAIFNGDAANTASMKIVNSIFYGNYAGSGGAIYNQVGDKLSIINCTMVSNESVYAGEALRCEDNTYILNSIIYGNGSFTYEVFADASNGATMEYSCFKSGTMNGNVGTFACTTSTPTYLPSPPNPLLEPNIATCPIAIIKDATTEGTFAPAPAFDIRNHPRTPATIGITMGPYEEDD